VVYSFCSEQYCPDGLAPVDGLIDVKGTFYGTTVAGGINSGGTVFAIDPKGSESVLYSFCSQQNCADGAGPLSSLLDVKGTLYGTTQMGGASAMVPCYPYGGCGTVFALDPNTGAETVLYSLCSRQKCKDGELPKGGLIDVDGTLYGTAQEGGTTRCENHSGCGTAFSIKPETGKEKLLYSFCIDQTCSDGQYPLATLIDVQGKLYGTTEFGGAYNAGTIFSIVP